MSRNRRHTLAAPPPDPFGELQRPRARTRLKVLGGSFEFETDSRRLLRLVHMAYAHLPAHTFGGRSPRFKVRLAVAPAKRARASGHAVHEPPPMRPLAGNGLLCGALGDSSFVAITPRQRSALLVVAANMLRHAYHVRYELLEFAVYVLAARVRGLVPLHAACLGHRERGLLLMGPSGSGKSTVVLHAALNGLTFLAEDSILVEPASLRATGVASFVHVRRDSLRFLTDKQRTALLEQAERIRRRSGVEKLEIDLRRPGFRLAATPLRIRAAVFLSRRNTGKRAQLVRLPTATVLGRLAAQQRYASQQPGWSAFCRQMSHLPGYELRRGSHPRAAIEALRELLAGP